MTVFGGRRKSAPWILLAAVAGFSLLATTAANAVVTTTTDLRSPSPPPSPLRGPSLRRRGPRLRAATTTTPPRPRTTCLPERQSRTARWRASRREGSTYGILTTGNAALADDANTAGDYGYGWNMPATAHRWGVYDWHQVVRVDLPAATTACLAFDFRFLSDEYPEYVNTNYNDAFIAQLDTWSVAVDPATQTVTAPGNFAGGAGDIISVDEAGRAPGRRGRARHHLRRRDPAADRPGTRGGRVGALAVPDDLRPGRRDPRQCGVPRQPALRDHRRRRSASRSRVDPFERPHRRLADPRQPAEAVEGQVDADVPGELRPASRSGLVQRDRLRGLHPDPGSGREPVVSRRSPRDATGLRLRDDRSRTPPVPSRWGRPTPG